MVTTEAVVVGDAPDAVRTQWVDAELLAEAYRLYQSGVALRPDGRDVCGGRCVESSGIAAGRSGAIGAARPAVLEGAATSGLVLAATVGTCAATRR